MLPQIGRGQQRRIVLKGGTVLEMGGGVNRLVHPAVCPACKRNVTAESDRDHVIDVPPTVSNVDATVRVLSCHGQAL